MRNLAYLTIPAALLASPALAQNASGSVEVDGTVAGRCLFGLPNATISLGEISVLSTGRLDTSRVNGRSATLNGWCNNTAATMTVTTTQLTTPTSAPSGFDNRVDYTGTAVVSSGSASDSSLTAGAGTAANVGRFNGDIVVTLSAAASPTGGLMVAGNYTGNVLVTLTPVN
jgi:hypothetical protein